MARLLRQPGDIPADVFGSSVMVVQDGGYLVVHNVPGLSEADVEGKDAVHNRKDDNEERILEEASDAEVRFLLFALL